MAQVYVLKSHAILEMKPKRIMMKKITLTLTAPQIREALEAIAHMTEGNAYDYTEMKKSGVKNPHTLVRAEQALIAAWAKREN